VTANLGVTRRRSLCRHVLLTAVWLNTTIGGSNTNGMHIFKMPSMYCVRFNTIFVCNK